jgi:general transcription factor 3C polypeptide 3 (transcription factor C subunit 4)
MLRQIKAMDYNLVGEESKERFTSEKGGYSAYDESGQLIVNDDMDVALLMLYGHILYTGSSYSYALSKSHVYILHPSTDSLPDYFLRAYALDPENPMVNLSIGLGYLHYALKRQAENRQFHIIQGMSFLFRYYDSRHISPRVEERQEAHYNIARSYHVLGLTHLALPYYSQVLLEARGFQYSREDLVRDAAYNLQSLYTMGGNIALAKDITDEWLII